MALDASVILKFLDQTQQGAQSAKRSAEDVSKSYEELSGKAEALTQRQSALREAYSELVPQVEAARKALSEAKKEFKEDGSDESAKRLQDAAGRYEELSGRLGDYRRGLADSRRELRSLDEQMRQSADNTARQGERAQQALSGWDLARAGWSQQMGSALSGALGYAISSGTTTEEGNIINGILSGVVTGASTGMLAGPHGALVGAVLGAGAGLVNGLTENARAEDDVFRSYRDAAVAQVEQNMTARLQGGSQTAATREQDLLAFGTLLGSPELGGAALEEIKNMANFTPYYYDDLVSVAKQLSVYGYGQQGGGDLMRTLTAIGNAGAAIGWNVGDQQTVAQQLGFLGELSSVSSQQIKQLVRKGLNVYDWLGEDLGLDRDAVQQRISSGGISGQQAVETILAHMESRFEGAMEALSHTYSGISSTVGGLTENLNAVMGEGYNEARKGGLEAQAAWLQDSGLEATYALIGEANAYADNYAEAVNREAMDAVFKGAGFDLIDQEGGQEYLAKLRADYMQAAEMMVAEDEQTRTEGGARMQAIYEQVEAFASSFSDASAKMDVWDESQLAVRNGVGSIVAILEAYKDQWALKQAESGGRTKALYGAYSAGTSVEDEDVVMDEGIHDDSSGNLAAYLRGGYDGSHAVGLGRVPRDGYRILAHEGERLLTRTEADALDRGAGGVTVSGNTFYVRQESDIDAIAEALAEKIERARRLGA